MDSVKWLRVPSSADVGRSRNDRLFKSRGLEKGPIQV